MKKDLLKLQNNYFSASVENAKEANSAIGKAQGWILTLGLAELAFLGVQGDFTSCSIKIETSFLLLAFIFFIVGSIVQYKHVLKKSRYYYLLSIKILEWVEEKGTSGCEKIPNELREDSNILKTSSTANYLLFSSFVLIIVSTILIWLSLIFI